VADAMDGLKVVDRPVPSLRRGQVLVRIEAAPCTPSDLLLLQGRCGVLKTSPCVPGWEAAGTVVASGGGSLAGWLKGTSSRMSTE
jgi:NADPH:quinone reductase-like Zn-dependent oxidoreductase